MYDVFMQRVGLVISNDAIASTVEKDAENQILLHFVIYIVAERIILGRSGKACLPGISKNCNDWLFLLYQNIIQTLWKCVDLKMSVGISFQSSFIFYLGGGKGGGQHTKMHDRYCFSVV